MKDLPYDKTSTLSIFNYSKNLIHKNFKEILFNDPNLDNSDKEIIMEAYNNPNSKGSLGQFIEKHFFFYDNNSNSEADFNEAGLELKITPYIVKKDKTLRAKERLVLSIINYMEDYKFSFEDSHVYSKCSIMLLIFYLYDIKKKKLDYIINYVDLFTFPKSDYNIIKNDYDTIITKIKNGKADEISESDTNYLGACTKGANSSSLRNQPFSNKKAKQRAFCLKNSYMTYILNNYISKNNHTYGSLIKDDNALKDSSLEEYIISKLSKYYGQDIEFLRKELDIPYKVSNKAFTYYLAKKMLKVDNKKIEEFEKANIQVKAIRLSTKGIPKEHMSFPAFKYTEIVKQDWENSDLYNTFTEEKYLFIIFQYKDNGTLIFKKAMFWNVPMKDLDTEIKRIWEETIKRIKENRYDDLPHPSESPIIHVRPHALNKQDTFPTLDGKQSMKKSFWFHKNYIKKQIEED